MQKVIDERPCLPRRHLRLYISHVRRFLRHWHHSISLFFFVQKGGPLLLRLLPYLVNDPYGVHKHEQAYQDDHYDGDLVHIPLEVEEPWQHHNNHRNNRFVKHFNTHHFIISIRFLQPNPPKSYNLDHYVTNKPISIIPCSQRSHK